ncbi:monocarboxylate transporter 9-like [Littorina saxatilis]|uniref:monocarboxylate transporter 9-like n=1 Tax=Littorina saxatilis TaxID=31220 RepID=UPI0038B62155
MTSGLAMLAGMYQKVFLDEFGGDVVMTSWITSLFASLMQLAGPVTGVVCSVFSCRLSVMVGAVLLTVGLVVSSFCENTTTLLLSFGISSGLGLGLIYSAAIVMVNLSFVHYRPVATGSVLAAGGVGIMVLPALCQYLLDAYSFWENLCIFSAMSAQLVVAGALLFPTSESSSSDGGFCRSRFGRCFKSQHPDTKDLQDKDMASRKSLSLAESCYLKDIDNSGCQDNHFRRKRSDQEQDIQTERNPYPPDECGLDSSKNDGKTEYQTSKDLNLRESVVQEETEADALLKDGDAEVGYKRTKEFEQKAECKKDNKVKSAQQENVALLASSVNSLNGTPVKNIHGSPEITMLSNSIRSIDLAFLVSSAESIQRKEDSVTKLSSTSTRQKLCTVFRRPSLLLLCLQMFLTNAAIGIVLVHFPEFCLQSGSHFETVSLSFSMNGLTLTMSRFLMGFLAQDRNIDPLAVYVGLLVMTSFFMVVTALVAVTPNTQIALLSFIGLYFGGSYSLLTEITIHCTGVDTLSLAFGMEMISAGLGFLIAPPIAGWLVVLTDSYSDAILLAGFLNFFAVFVAMAISMTRPVWKPTKTSDVTDSDVIPSPGDDRPTTNSSSNNPTEHLTQQQHVVRQ